MRDVDDDEMIRTDSGVYQITYVSDRDDVAQKDFDQELDEYEKEVDEIENALDKAADDLDDDVNKD